MYFRAPSAGQESLRGAKIWRLKVKGQGHWERRCKKSFFAHTCIFVKVSVYANWRPPCIWCVCSVFPRAAQII